MEAKWTVLFYYARKIFKVRFCCFVEQSGSEELVDYNYFQWCSEQIIEEKLGLKNKEMNGLRWRWKKGMVKDES